MKKLISSTIAAIILPLSISFSAPLKVITSFSILEDFTENIGKDLVSVHAIIGPDQDAHSFEPSPKDIITIQSADMVVLNGVGFDNWLQKILDANNYEGVIVHASQDVPLLTFTEEHSHDHTGHSHTEHEGHDHGEFDPHIWQSPLNAIIMAQNITTGLSLAAPESAPYFDNNFKDYKASLESLNTYANNAFNDLNKEASLMVLHNSFGYLAAAYGLYFVAVSDLNPLAEPSAKKMAELYRFVEEENIQAIFSENIAPSRFIDTLSKDLNLQDGGILYSDALTKAQPTNTYINLFKHNVDQIRHTLEKTAAKTPKE